MNGSWWDERTDEFIEYEAVEPTVSYFDPLDVIPLFGPDGSIIGGCDPNRPVGFARALEG